MQRSAKDTILLSILSCLWAVQAVILVQQWLGYGPAPMWIKDTVLPEAMVRVLPKWDLLLYVVFITAALGLGQLLFKCVRKPLNGWIFVVEGTVTFLMISAAFKMVIYDNSPQLAQRCLTTLLIVSALSKLFYTELQWIAAKFYRRINAAFWARYADHWWIAAIVLFIYVPDLERVVAMIFIGDWLHHFDFFIMSPGWVALSGQVPFVEYGLGLPIIFAHIIHAVGSFDYVPALSVMMWFVILYFILTYFVVKYWLKSALMAGVAFLLIFRLQLFHYGVSPLIWCTLSASPVRFGLDILWMAALLMHLRTGRLRWLMAAGVYSGFAVYYMTSVGFCVMGTFYLYLLALFFFNPKQGREYYLCWLLPILSMLVFFGLTLKGELFQRDYWHNLIDYMQVFERFGSLPMYESLKYRHYWAFFMSMAMLFTYVATLLYIGIGLYIEKKLSERLFVAVLCVYGLANYQYYVVRSAITSYDMNALPFVLVCCFWFMRVLEFVPVLWQKRLRAAAVVLSFYALLTNHNYLAYPNCMNFSRNPMTDNLVIQRFPDRQGFFNNQYKNVKEKDKLAVNDLGTKKEDLLTEDDFKNDAQLVDYYHQHSDFSQDAALIDSLTQSGEKVALLSSFETKILIQADRPPFFYHFCVISSRPMTFRSLPYAADATRTPDYLPDTFREFREEKPEYVFMEKVFLQENIPQAYLDNDMPVLTLVAYIKAHYVPFKEGQYLVAMKRRSDS